MGALVTLVALQIGREPALVDRPATIDTSGAFAPASAWVDVPNACSSYRHVLESYGQAATLPFSEVLWLNQLVNVTELMGATTTGYGDAGLSDAEQDVASAAGEVRLVTIGGGLSHPEFPRVTAALLDACDALPAV